MIHKKSGIWDISGKLKSLLVSIQNDNDIQEITDKFLTLRSSTGSSSRINLEDNHKGNIFEIRRDDEIVDVEDGGSFDDEHNIDISIIDELSKIVNVAVPEDRGRIVNENIVNASNQQTIDEPTQHVLFSSNKNDFIE